MNLDDSDIKTDDLNAFYENEIQKNADKIYCMDISLYEKSKMEKEIGAVAGDQEQTWKIMERLINKNKKTKRMADPTSRIVGLITSGKKENTELNLKLNAILRVVDDLNNDKSAEKDVKNIRKQPSTEEPPKRDRIVLLTEAQVCSYTMRKQFVSDVSPGSEDRIKNFYMSQIHKALDKIDTMDVNVVDLRHLWKEIGDIRVNEQSWKTIEKFIDKQEKRAAKENKIHPNEYLAGLVEMRDKENDEINMKLNEVLRFVNELNASTTTKQKKRVKSQPSSKSSSTKKTTDLRFSDLSTSEVSDTSVTVKLPKLAFQGPEPMRCVQPLAFHPLWQSVSSNVSHTSTSTSVPKPPKICSATQKLIDAVDDLHKSVIHSYDGMKEVINRMCDNLAPPTQKPTKMEKPEKRYYNTCPRRATVFKPSVYYRKLVKPSKPKLKTDQPPKVEPVKDQKTEQDNPHIPEPKELVLQPVVSCETQPASSSQEFESQLKLNFIMYADKH